MGEWAVGERNQHHARQERNEHHEHQHTRYSSHRIDHSPKRERITGVARSIQRGSRLLTIAEQSRVSVPCGLRVDWHVMVPAARSLAN